jgi:hypothetical protein
VVRTGVLYPKRRHSSRLNLEILEDGILHSHRNENLKSYKCKFCSPNGLTIADVTWWDSIRRNNAKGETRQSVPTAKRSNVTGTERETGLKLSACRKVYRKNKVKWVKEDGKKLNYFNY